MTTEHDRLIGYWKLDSDNTTLCAQLLESYRKENRFSEGCDFFQRLSKTVKAEPSLQLIYSNLLLSMGRYSDAEQSLTPAHVQHPLDVYISYNLAYARYAQKNISASLQTLEPVAHLWQSCPEILELKGRCLRVLGDSEAAIPVIKQYLTVANDVPTMGFLSLLYSDCGHHEAACSIAKEVLNTSPTQLDSLAAATSSSIALNRYRDAEDFLNLAVDVYSDVTMFWSQRGFVAFATGKPSKAVNYYRRALETVPADNELLFSLALSELANNELGQAKAIFEKIRLQTPNDGDVYSALSIVCTLMKEPAEASQNLERALQKTPNSFAAKLASSLIMTEQGQDSLKQIQSLASDPAIKTMLTNFSILNLKNQQH